MTDRFSNHAVTRESPGQRHWTIVPHATQPLDPRPRVIYAATAGTVTIRDAAGTALAYAMAAGEILPFSAYGITESTATLYGWD